MQNKEDLRKLIYLVATLAISVIDLNDYLETVEEEIRSRVEPLIETCRNLIKKPKDN